MPEDINLLPQQSAEEQPQSKSHRMLNSISLLVLIVTIVAAVAAVTIKLGLQAQSSSLNNKITEKKQQVEKYHDQEGTYLLVQNKLAHAQKFLASQNHYSNFLKAVQSTIPQSVTFQDLTVDKTGLVTIDALSTSYGDIAGFFSKVQNASATTVSNGKNTAAYFTNPMLANINRNAQTGQITFTVKFNIAPALLAAPSGGAQ